MNDRYANGILFEAVRRTNSRNGNSRYLVHLKGPDGEIRTYPTKTDASVNYDVPNAVGKEVTLTLDALNRVVYLQEH